MAGAALQRFGILTVLFSGFAGFIGSSGSGAGTIMMFGFVVGIFGLVIELMAAVDD